MGQQQKQFREMNDRLTARVQIPPRTMIKIIIGEVLWFTVLFYSAAHETITGLPVFILMVIGLLVPVVILNLKSSSTGT